MCARGVQVQWMVYTDVYCQTPLAETWAYVGMDVHTHLERHFAQIECKCNQRVCVWLAFVARYPSACYCLVVGVWGVVGVKGPLLLSMTDNSNKRCLNIRPRVSPLISVCHSY